MKMKAGCCFCDKSVEGKEVYVLKLTNWETKEESKIGGFACHLECFKKKLHSNFEQIAKYMERHVKADQNRT